MKLMIYAILALVSAAAAYRLFREFKRIYLAVGIMGLFVAFAMFAWATVSGGRKTPTPEITWDEGLHDNGSEISTNDPRVVTFRWTFATYIPAVATITIHAIERQARLDSDLFEVGSCNITDLSYIAQMPQDATNYLFYVEQSYIPPTPIQTNGVYHLKAVGGNSVFVPIGLTIYNDWRQISPPKKEDEQP